MTDEQKVSDALDELQRWVMQERIDLVPLAPDFNAKYTTLKAVGAKIRALRAAPTPEVHSEVGDRRVVEYVVMDAHGCVYRTEDELLALSAAKRVRDEASQPIPAGVVDDAMVERMQDVFRRSRGGLITPDKAFCRKALTAALQNAGGEPVAWRRLFNAAETVCQKLESDTATVTIFDQSELRCSLEALSPPPTEGRK